MSVKLTKVMEIWDELHIKDTGEIGFCDLEQAIEKVVGVENDARGTRRDLRSLPKATGD